MNNSRCMIFFCAGDHDLNTAERLLSKAGLSAKRDGNILRVRWANGPELRIEFADGEETLTEATDIGRGSPFAEAMTRCNRRYEISFDSLEEVLDEINTLIEVQLTLQNAVHGYLFLGWNGNLSGPNE